MRAPDRMNTTPTLKTTSHTVRGAISKSLIGLICFFTAFPLMATSLSGNYSVGSTGHFKTLSQAIDSLKINGVSGPVVLNLQAQSFNEQIEFTSISGGSATNTITLKGLGDSSIVSYSASSTKRPIINLNGAKHIIIDSIKIESSGSYGIGINLMNAADSNVIQNCTILLNSTSATYLSSGIANFSAVSGSGSAFLKSLHVNNNVIDGGHFGIRLTNTTSASNFFTIEKNTVTDFGRYGMELSGCIQMEVVGNRVNSGVTTATSTIKMWPTAHSIKILNNTVDLASDANHTRVIQVANAPGGGGSSWAEEVLVANNFVSYHGNHTANMTGIYTKHVNYLKIHNNTVVMDSTNGAKSLWFDALNATGNIESKNNILVNNFAGGHSLFVHGSVTVTLNHNDFFNPTGVVIRYKGTNYTSLSGYQNATGQGANSVSIDPDFVSSSDYHINTRNSRLDNRGVVLSSVKTDFDGDTRNSSHPDIGADEFISGADIAILGFSEPTNCRNATPAVPVEIWIKNVDSKDISNFAVSYQVNGGTITTEVYTGTLKARDSVRYGFSKSAVMTKPGIYSITAFSSFLADEVTNNDTAMVQIAIKNIYFNLPDSVGGCSGEDIVINPGSFAGATYLWSDNSSGSTLTFNSNKTGRSKHWVQIKDANGCAVSDTFDVVVSDAITESLGPDTSLCPSTSLTLDLNQTGGSYVWHNGSTSNQFHIASPGIYSVNISTGYRCSKADTINVDYHMEPTVNLGADLSICEGSNLRLSSSDTFASYLWQDNSTDSILSANQEGLYWVKVTDSNACSTSDSLYLTVKDSPKIDLVGDTSICQGDTLHMDVTVDGYQYLWQDNSTLSTFRASTQGLYIVMATNAKNCTTRDSMFLTVTTLPNVRLGNDTAICEGSSLFLDVTIPRGTYKWQDDTGNPVYTALVAGKYSVDVTDSLGCVNSGEINLEVNPNPNVDLGKDTFLQVDSLKIQPFTLSAGSGFESYLWSNNNTSESIEIDDTYAIGIYNLWVLVEDNNGCTGRDTIRLNIGKTNSVLDHNLGAFKVYPNPNDGRFILDMTDNFGSPIVETYDSKGQLLFTTEVRSKSVRMDLSNYPKGVYMIRMVAGDGIRYAKVVVQ